MIPLRQTYTKEKQKMGKNITSLVEYITSWKLNFRHIHITIKINDKNNPYSTVHCNDEYRVA